MSHKSQIQSVAGLSRNFDEDENEREAEPVGFYYSSEDDEKWGESHPLINIFSCGWCEGNFTRSFSFVIVYTWSFIRWKIGLSK